ALRFELEGELLEDLEDLRFSIDIRGLDQQSAEVLVLLFGKERTEKLQRICLERDLLIRSIDCTAYALFRELFQSSSTMRQADEGKNLLSSEEHAGFQVYLGADEAFINTIQGQRLEEIKFFPNRLAELSAELTENGKLQDFLYEFAAGTSEEESPGPRENLEQELEWLCGQFTRHLRGRDYSSGSRIMIHGIFSPAIEWDGIRFKMRSFPLPEAETLKQRQTFEEDAEESELEETFVAESEVVGDESQDPAPDTLDELMEEASRRSEEEETPEEDTLELPPAVKEEQVPQISQISLLNLTGRQMWGVLGDTREALHELHEKHSLSLYSDSTPWRRFLHRNRGGVFSLVLFTMVLLGGWYASLWIHNQSLRDDLKRTDQLLQNEIQRVFPEGKQSGIESAISGMSEKIRKRRQEIKVSKSFEERNYKTLDFLNRISTLLEEPGVFRIDQMEYGKDRFSMSGSIESYDRLQLLKNGLMEIEEFKDQRIVESNRKSQEGIIFRISIDLK
ncbi:MAG: hypothetical protein VYE57_07085, partial [SAR324 cluster bacterium]|nr:hypothetical protein [SAR324 cluster bacterium]